MSITVNSNITPTFTQAGPYCQNATTTALPTTSTNSISGTWSPSAVSTTTAGTTTYTFTPNGATCAVPTTMSIVVNANPTVSLTSTTICTGQSATLTPTVNPIGGIYSWSNGQTTTSITVSPTATTTFTLTYTTNNCPTTATGTVTVNPNATPTFTQLGPYCLNATPGTLPTTSNNSITGTWNPATISTATAGTTTYTFTPTAGLCATTATMSIVINQPATPTFNAINPVCQFATAPTLSNNSTNSPIITGTWSPSTVATTTVGTTTYTFTPSNGECATTTTLSIQVKPIPTISLSSQTICSGQSITLTPTVNPNGGTYTWSNNSTGSSLTISPTITTSYSVLYTLNGCNATGNTSITVTPNATPTFTQLGPYCQGATPGMLASSSNNNISGTWSPSTISTTATGNTNYTFTPNAGVCANTATMAITINPIVNPTFTPINTICLNSNAPALPSSSTNTPAITGTWTPSSINTSIAGIQTFTFTPATGQCASNASLSIQIIDVPNPTFTISDTVGCAPFSTTLTASNYPNTNYSWSSNGISIGTGQSISSTFQNAGCYDITLSINQSGCTASQSIQDMVCVEIPPSTSFIVVPSYLTSNNQNVSFINTTIGAISYDWDLGDGTTSIVETPNHTYSTTQNVLITLTGTNAFGCSSVYQLVLPFREETIFYVPNSFTPDGDEHNQTWGPVFSSGYDPYHFNCYVFDRWGELIWESHNADIKWDGTYGKNGAKCQDGTYTWKIEFKNKETDAKMHATGTIQLIR